MHGSTKHLAKLCGGFGQFFFLPSVLVSTKKCTCTHSEQLFSSQIVNSFIDMTPVLLGLPGVTYVLSEKLCQDVAKSIFGKQRARGGRSDNPTVKQFWNIVSLRVQSSAAQEPVRGKCGKRKT